MITSAMTSKGQITVPKKIREFPGVGDSDKVSFTPLEDEICKFLQALIATANFTMPDEAVIRIVVRQYQRGLDFADALITSQAKKEKALVLFRFDISLSKKIPEFVFNDFKKIKRRF